LRNETIEVAGLNLEVSFSDDAGRPLLLLHGESGF